MQPANTTLPAQTVVFAFAVCLLCSNCAVAVAELLIAQLLCNRQTAKQTLQFGRKYSVDLRGGCVVDWQLLMIERIWTGLMAVLQIGNVW